MKQTGPRNISPLRASTRLNPPLCVTRSIDSQDFLFTPHDFSKGPRASLTPAPRQSRHCINFTYTNDSFKPRRFRAKKQSNRQKPKPTKPFNPTTLQRPHHLRRFSFGKPMENGEFPCQSRKSDLNRRPPVHVSIRTGNNQIFSVKTGIC